MTPNTAPPKTANSARSKASASVALPASEPALDIDISHTLGAFTVQARFRAPAGVTALFGASGSGKTTLVNAVAGLLRPDAGHVRIGAETLFDSASGFDLPPHRRRIGYVFQDARLFPHLTVRQNLSFGRWFAPRGVALADPEPVIDLLGIEPLLGRRPGRLSGGERQRVAIGRALLSGARLLLMDEPLAALDEPRKAEIMPYLERLRDETDIPILYVSHAVSEVARLATTVVALKAGRVVRVGPAATVLADPEAVPSLGVRDAGAVLQVRVTAHDPADGLTELATSAGPLFVPQFGAAIGTPLRVRVEAHDVILAAGSPDGQPPTGLSAVNILPATVTEIRVGDGPGAAVQLWVGRDQLLARITKRSLRLLGLRVGSPCYAVVKSMAIARRDIGG